MMERHLALSLRVARLGASLRRADPDLVLQAGRRAWSVKDRRTSLVEVIGDLAEIEAWLAAVQRAAETRRRA